ncbi:MAG: hypothetical protein ACREAC_15870, partial [Blastocatellia bacterium]
MNRISRKGRETSPAPIIGVCYDPSRQQIVVASVDETDTVRRLSHSDSEEPLVCSEIRVVAPGHSASTERYDGTTFSLNATEEELNVEILNFLAGNRNTEAADWSRSETGIISVTTVEPSSIDDAVRFANELAGVASPLGPRPPSEPEGFPHFSEGSRDGTRPLVRVETPMRALARFWIEAHSEAATKSQGCAFVLADSRACSVAFWSAEGGFLHEIEQEFPEESRFGDNQVLTQASNVVRSLLTAGSLATIGIERLSALI